MEQGSSTRYHSLDAVRAFAMLLGVVREAADTDSEFSAYDVSRPLHDINAPDNMNVLSLAERGTARPFQAARSQGRLPPGGMPFPTISMRTFSARLLDRSIL